MTTPVKDGYAGFRELVFVLRSEGFGVTAARLDTMLQAAWTSSSELLGELGQEILAFQRCGYEPVSPELRRSLDACLSVVRRVWPHIQ